MKPRHIEPIILRYAQQYPIIAIVGPRQSGKTTLARHLFPGHSYLSLESPDVRAMASEDPRAFLEQVSGGMIIDEVQRVPKLFSYLQEYVDANQEPGRYVLTGSQQFMLMEGITQSLAGRVALFTLYPFSYAELVESNPSSFIPSGMLHVPSSRCSFAQIALNGFYPRVHDKALDPVMWYEQYITTYIERDVRLLAQVGNLDLFHLLLKLIAGRTGSLVNYASLANELGVALPTVKRWVSLLHTSGILFLLKPWFKGYGKRLVKTHKMYLVDVGLACSLLGIDSQQVLRTHPAYGALFENMVIAELYKMIAHGGMRAELSFWRDKTGNEVDCLVESGMNLLAVEIKSAQTYNPSMRDSLNRWLSIAGESAARGYLVYDGKTVPDSKNAVKIVSWQDVVTGG